MGVGVGARDLCGREQGVILVQGGGEAVGAVSPGRSLADLRGGLGLKGFPSSPAIVRFSSSSDESFFRFWCL